MIQLQGHTSRIENIHVYLMQVHAVRNFSFGTWTSRQHVFVCLQSKDHQGWGENIISVNNPQVSLDSWISVLKQLKGLTLEEALLQVRSHMGIWRDRLTEVLEMALFDLAGKCAGVPALSLLGLEGEKPVHGAYVILSDKLEVVEASIKTAIASNRAQVVKVKLFGDLDLDTSIINLIRTHAPRESTFLLGDVNCGYCRHEFDVPLQEIEIAMHHLEQAGLDACEDPAALTMEGWAALQQSCPNLALIPDYPLRPARQARKTLLAGMGKFYNIHPGSAASLIDAIELARTIQGTFNAGLMIGDDSLIGPGCTIWQQVAIGLQAAWVEAIEKDGDSDGFETSIRSISTNRSGSLISTKKPVSGFGIELDFDCLASIASKTLIL